MKSLVNWKMQEMPDEILTTKVNLWVGGTIDVPSDHPMFKPKEELKAMIQTTDAACDRAYREGWTEAEIQAGAEALAARFFWDGNQQPFDRFSESQQQDFRNKARAVLEAVRLRIPGLRRTATGVRAAQPTNTTAISISPPPRV